MSKHNREAKNEIFVQLLNEYFIFHKGTYRKFTGSHYRVYTLNSTVDFFLSGMRYHNIKTGVRGNLAALDKFDSLL